MSSRTPDERFDVALADFDAAYRGEPLVEGLQFAGVPWDIGEPQPAVVDLERDGRLFGEVLDVGCGLGENAIFLAGRGHRVTGVDAAPTAIDRARERARSRGVDVEFAVADATVLAGYEGRFDSVLDSALYHCLGEEQRTLYAAALHRATRPGALLSLMCFAGTPGAPSPFGVSEENLRTTLPAAGWTITDLRQTTYLASLAGIGDLALPFGELLGVNPTADERGRVRITMWAVQARRA